MTTLHMPMITIEVYDNGISAMARLKVGDNVVCYEDGSRYGDVLVEALEKRLAIFLSGMAMQREDDIAERWEWEAI